MPTNLSWRPTYLLTYFVILLIVFFWIPLHASLEQEFPVLYKGRYRPAEAYARLWLYELYHAQTLKQDDLTSFHTSSPSSLSFLWSLNFLGHGPYQEAPLFWIKSAEMKSLAQLPLTRDRFSYRELQEALYRNQKSSEAIAKRLIIYHFLEAYLNLSSPPLRIELTSLLPGLWLQWKGREIVILTVPGDSPWNFLKKGEILASLPENERETIIKRDKQLAEDWSVLFTSLKEFENLQGRFSSMERSFHERFLQLQAKAFSSKQIEQILEQEFPLLLRLQSASSLFKALPSRYKKGDWFPLQALTTQIYQASSHTLQPVSNFTLFSDSDFEAIREAYLNLEEAIIEPLPIDQQQERLKTFISFLAAAYQALEGKTFQEAHGKLLKYPTFTQLKMEALYMSYPWIPLLILLYGLGAIFWIIAYRLSLPFGKLAALTVTICAILCHTGLLAIRCYILGRPPVSNMFETVIYVPWVAACISLFFPTFRCQPLVLLAACLSSMILLLILEVTDLNQSLEQVQAVLDSQFWLMIHVLLVVGSYGVFILGALIGHFYLGLFMKHHQETSKMRLLAQIILQTMYGGTLLLVVGTILGGIWAAESWGRFWDWDPKESWAFISSCFYLIWIHAYRFRCITSFGLAIGAVSGLLSISFTWYGVNYILGTGLHSYGFGSGGGYYYFAFLSAECLFLTIAIWSYFYYRPLISYSSISNLKQ